MDFINELTKRLRDLERRIQNLEGWEPTVSTIGAGPKDATYLTLSYDGDLTGERLLTPGTLLSGIDNGANSTYVLNVDESSIDHGNLTGLADDDHAQYLLTSGLRDWDEQAGTPSNPAANKWKLYAKSDGFYYLDDTGAEIGPLGVTPTNKDLFVQTTDAVIANTVTETSLFSTGIGSLSLGSSFLTAGKALHIQMRGRLSDTGTPNLTIQIKLGSTVVSSSGAVTLTSITNIEWMLDALVTCRSDGVTGVVVGGGLFDYDDGTEFSLESGSNITIDTTAALTLDVTATWSAADVSNTITAREAVVRVIDPAA